MATTVPEPLAEQVERERTAPRSWWMLSVLLALYILSFVDRYVMTMLVVPIQRDTGLSDVQMSLIMGTAFAVFYAIFGIPLGWAADRYPRRWVIYIGVTIWSLAAAGTGLARSFWTMFLARTFVGIGEASLTPAAYSLLADGFPRHRLTLAISIYQMGVKIGSAAAFAIGAAALAFAHTLIDHEWPLFGQLKEWEMVLIMTGAPGLILALLVFSFTEPPRRQAKRPVTHERGQLVAFLKKERSLLGLMLFGFTAMTIAGYSLSSWVPTYLVRVFRMDPVEFGPVLAVISLAAAGSMVLKGWFVDWLYLRGIQDAHLRFYSWLLGATAPVAFLLFFISDKWLFLVLYGVIQVVAIQFAVYMGATLQIIAPTHLRAQTTALFLGTFTILGLGAGPIVVGAITDYVFADQSMIGYSLAIVVSIAYPLAFLSIRLALPRAQRAIAEAG